MSDQNKNAGTPPTEKEPKNAGGVDDVEEGEERLDKDDRVDEEDKRQAGGLPSPDPTNSAWGGQRKS